MKCERCNGRVLLDRTFTDNKNYETSCLVCGDRKFIEKESVVGVWLSKKERARRKHGVLGR